jgi:hypothetical protein
MTLRYVVDIGLSLEDPEWSEMDFEIDRVAGQRNLYHVSGGTGFGFRDKQFETLSEPLAQMFAEWVAKEFGIKKFTTWEERVPFDMQSYVCVFSYDPEEMEDGDDNDG